MIPSLHISNKLNESIVLGIRIVVTLVGTAIISSGSRGTSWVLIKHLLFHLSLSYKDLWTFHVYATV